MSDYNEHPENGGARETPPLEPNYWWLYLGRTEAVRLILGKDLPSFSWEDQLRDSEETRAAIADAWRTIEERVGTFGLATVVRLAEAEHREECEYLVDSSEEHARELRYEAEGLQLTAFELEEKARSLEDLAAESLCGLQDVSRELLTLAEDIELRALRTRVGHAGEEGDRP